jgi:hypothetical protein
MSRKEIFPRTVSVMEFPGDFISLIVWEVEGKP